MMQSSCLLVYACCYCFLSPHEYASHVNSIHCFAFQVPQTKLVTFFVYHTFAPLSGTHSGAFKIKKVCAKKNTTISLWLNCHIFLIPFPFG